MPRARVWARGEGIALVETGEVELTDGLEQAIRDGVARNYRGELPEPPAGMRCYLVRSDGETVGLLGVADGPGESAATIVGVAIDPAARGRALGTHAVRVAERRLRREGIGALFARAPRGNGHGLYFWLRAGFAPEPSPEAGDDATWFRAR